MDEGGRGSERVSLPALRDCDYRSRFTAERAGKSHRRSRNSPLAVPYEIAHPPLGFLLRRNDHGLYDDNSALRVRMHVTSKLPN